MLGLPRHPWPRRVLWLLVLGSLSSSHRSKLHFEVGAPAASCHEQGRRYCLITLLCMQQCTPLARLSQRHHHFTRTARQSDRRLPERLVRVPTRMAQYIRIATAGLVVRQLFNSWATGRIGLIHVCIGRCSDFAISAQLCIASHARSQYLTLMF